MPKRSGLLKVLLIVVLLGAACPETGYAQSREVEEIVVNFHVPRLLKTDIFARYSGTDIYLPLIEIFGLLELNIEADFLRRRFTGFVISKNNKYEIDLVSLIARAQGGRHRLFSSDYFLIPPELYLRIDLFKQLFDLNMEFSFSALQVSLRLDEEFPAYKKLIRRQAHKRLKVKKAALRDVKHLPRKPRYLAGGVADWAVSASPIGGGGQYYDLAVGGLFLGGDLSVAGSGNSITGFNSRRLNYKWHYYFDNNRYITQVDLGHVYTSGLLSRQLEGGLLTNRPQIQRKFFQTINISNYIGNGWEVELYINNQLTDYVYTDQTGEYNFTVDIHYGTTEIVLRMYGPNGEMRTEWKYVGIPYNLIPEKTFEYTIAAGVADNVPIDEEGGKYAQTRTFYGVTNRVTVGLGSDLPLADGNGEKPTFESEVTGQIAGSLTANASIAPGYASSFALNYSRSSWISFNSSFTRYFENRFRNKLDQIHSLTFSASWPLRIGRRYCSVRYSVSWNKYPGYHSVNMSYGSSASLFRFHFNYIGHLKISKYSERTVSSMTSQFIASPWFFRWIKPQLRMSYDHTSNRVSRVGIQWNRRIFKTGQLTLSFERNNISKSNTIMLTAKLFSGFADFTSRLIYSGGHTSMSQVQRGSVLYDQQGRRLRFDRRNGVGLASAVVRPFLDDNYNGILDKGEQFIPGLKARIKGGRERRSGRENHYYYDGLRAYDQYLIQLDQYSLDDPLLQPTYENYKVFCYPNIVTPINVPLVTASEVSGHVEQRVGNVTTGQGGIRLILLNLSKETVTEITTFSGGEFYHLGLIPGSYRAYIDPGQLERHDCSSEPRSIEFEVMPVEGGTSIENINFLLIPKG